MLACMVTMRNRATSKEDYVNGKTKYIMLLIQGWTGTIVVAAVTVLGYTHTISGEAVIGALGAVIGLAGGTTSSVLHSPGGDTSSPGSPPPQAPPTV